MSRFLGPIHHWLYNKINLLEEIEKEVIRTLSPDTHEQIMAEMAGQYGPYLNNQPLETLIDQDNIHGWLQARIKVAETRQSAVIARYAAQDAAVYEKIAIVYAQIGSKYAKALAGDNPPASPEDIFKSLDNYLLEGMPCDRVNAITESTESSLKWQKDRCVHADFWNTGGTDVKHYYAFREAFSKAFVEGLNPAFSYEFELKNALQYHMIFKK